VEIGKNAQKKFGGNRQNGQKNLVEIGKTPKKIWWKLAKRPKKFGGNWQNAQSLFLV
jgi:hypothetical protein